AVVHEVRPLHEAPQERGDVGDLRLRGLETVAALIGRVLEGVARIETDRLPESGRGIVMKEGRGMFEVEEPGHADLAERLAVGVDPSLRGKGITRRGRAVDRLVRDAVGELERFLSAPAEDGVE